MPYYKPLKKYSTVDRQRILAGIKRIRLQLEKDKFPIKKYSKSLILGTWNLRNFDDDRFGYGPRTREAIHYIAEIISRFDVIAVQEICEDLFPLDDLLRLLGGHYSYILTDVTHSKLGGNGERLGFIYDTHKVQFKGIAGEIVLPEDMLISEVAEKKRQFSRTPFSVQFQSGWFKFLFSTVHIYYGKDGVKTPEYKRRVQEIDAIAKYLATEARRSDANYILVGDFNIVSRQTDDFNALEAHGFKTVQNRLGSNRDQTRFYDQISFISRRNELRMMEPQRDNRVIQFFDSVYRTDDFEQYKPVILGMMDVKTAKAQQVLATATRKTDRDDAQKTIDTLNSTRANDALLRKYYEEWRTFQMSDHLPLWVELEIDFSDDYLKYLEKLA